jgi:hypothetical protein
MKYFIILLLSIITFSVDAQTSKRTVKKKIVPKSYSTIVKPKTLLAADEKRILKIDLDSILLNNNVTIREIIKGDSINTIVDYTVNVYLMPSNDSIMLRNTQGNIYIKITEVNRNKFPVFKEKEADRLNKQISDIDKQKANWIKERDSIRKQN